MRRSFGHEGKRSTVTSENSPHSHTGAVTPGALALVAVLSVLWGINFPSIKVAVSEVPPWTFRVLCILCGSVGLLTIGRLILGHSLRIPREDLPRLTVAALLNVTGWQLCAAFGLMQIEAGRGAIIAYTMPLWAAVLAWPVLGERLTPGRIAGLLLGLVGIAVLIGPDLDSLRGAPGGALLMLGASVCWAAGTVVIKSRRWSMPVIILTGWQLILGGIPIVVGMLVFEAGIEYPTLTSRGWLALAYSAVVPMIVCHFIWYTLVGMLPTAVAAISTLAIPIVGVYSSALLLGEQVGMREWLALALVVAALGIVLALPAARRILRRNT